MLILEYEVAYLLRLGTRSHSFYVGSGWVLRDVSVLRDFDFCLKRDSSIERRSDYHRSVGVCSII